MEETDPPMIERAEASAELAYRAILAEVENGTLKPGDRVPEAQVAATLGISRTPVREALRRLGAEGIVHIIHNQGARIAVWGEEDVQEVFELRMVIEGFAAALAARKAKPANVEKLRQIEREFERVIEEEAQGYRSEAAKLNNLFHLEILNIAGNQRLISVMSQLVQLPLTRGSFHRYTRREFDHAIRHHRDIIHAFAMNDALGAELGMKVHINSARMAMLAAAASAATGEARGRRADAKGLGQNK